MRALAFLMMVGGGMLLLPVMIWVVAYVHTWISFLVLLIGG